MTFNVSVVKNHLSFKRFLMFSGFLTLLLFTSISFGQTAEAEKNFTVCKACHTIGGGNLVGPDLKGVTERRDEAWLIKFIQNSQALIQSGDADAIQVFEEFNKIPMPPHTYTEDQIKDILLYIKNDGKVATSEKAEEMAEVVEKEAITPVVAPSAALEGRKDMQNMQITFYILLVLFFLSLIDLTITHVIKQKWIHYIIILTALYVDGEVIFVEATSLGRQQYYQPEQPVWFSHKVHAGQNQIDCMYCHFTADKSQHAGIPPVAVCMNCHSQVRSGKITGETEIAKVVDAYKNNKPIKWIKVHNLPDHVYFNHAQHYDVGKVECEECHGAVEQMDEIIQVEDLSMGWCIDCHRTKEVQFANNKFYEQYTKMHEKIVNGEKTKVTVADMGGEDCQRCHY